MTNTNLSDALEICLQSMDQGADMESCLVLFPELAKELRPILTAAVRAQSITAPTVPVEVVRRGRARLLQAASEMREQKKVVAVLPFWRRKGFFGPMFARLAFSSLAVIAFLLTGGTGLVNASSAALPGDHLYPIKRSWEGVRLIFVFDSHAKERLEQEFDHERVEEIEELYTVKRIAEVNFQGVVQEINPKNWVIDGLSITIESDTQFSGDIYPGALVQVMGQTDDGHINAQHIILLATPGATINPSATFTPMVTRTPEPSETHTQGEGEEGGGWASNTPGSKNGSDDSNERKITSTPHPGDDDEHESHGGEATSTSTGGHDDGEGEHHATSTPGSEHPRKTATPHPTEDH